MLKYGPLFLGVRALGRLVLGRSRLVGEERLNSPAVYVVHHQNLNGPVMALGALNEPVRLWVLHVFFSTRHCFEQYSGYTFSKRRGGGRWWRLPAAALASAVVPSLLRSARCLPVYRGMTQLEDTFEQSLAALIRGESLLIAPDVAYADPSPEMGPIYLGFLNLEPRYYQRTGQHLRFIPLYCSRRSRQVLVGPPVSLSEGAVFQHERERLGECLREAVNALGRQAGDIVSDRAEGVSESVRSCL